MDLLGAAANVRDRAVAGHLADLRRMPRELIDEAPSATLYRYLPLDGQASQPDPDLAPVLLVPPLGAPDFAYDLRRGCSLVEHLLGTGRAVYLVDYGEMHFGDRRRGMEHWVDGIVPWAVRAAAQDAGGPLHLLGWSLAGIF